MSNDEFTSINDAKGFSGVIYCGSAIGWGTPTGYSGILLVFSSTYTAQIFIPHTSQGVSNLYYRFNNADSWSAWQKLEATSM